jgi:hypothetical protein
MRALSLGDDWMRRARPCTATAYENVVYSRMGCVAVNGSPQGYL